MPTFGGMGMIVVSDQRQGGVVVLTHLTRDTTWMVGVPTPALAPLPIPGGLAITPDARMIFADRASGRLIAMERDGSNVSTLDPSLSPVGRLKDPSGVALGPDGSVYVADTGNSRVVRASSLQQPDWSAYGSPGTQTPGGFTAPSAVAVDGSGRIIVADPGGNRLVRFDDLTGAGWTQLAMPGIRPVPYGLSVDAAGILVTDFATRSVLRLDPTDALTVLFDGTAELIAPIAAAMDGDSIVVADAGAAQLTRWEYAGATWKLTEALVGVQRALAGPIFTRLSGLAIT